MTPYKRFSERFKTARNVSFVNCQGMFPDNSFLERSNDSSNVKSSNEADIGPMKPLCERLSTWSNLRLHIDFGISPWNLLCERSTEATKLKEAGVYSTIDPANFSIPTAAEIESNHITHCLITSDAFPRAAISVRVPRIEP
ncbi:hypothetical protein AAC387_Pa10g1999 [Persea americana]